MSEPTVADGDRVQLAYTGRFEDGTVFATSDPAVAAAHGLAASEAASEATPLTFRVGHDEVIPGLETAVIGLEVGTETTVTVPPEAAYGAYDPDRVRTYTPTEFEEMVGRPPEIGAHVEAQNGLHGDVTAITDEAVEVDFNHELAGKTLHVELEVLDIN
ncbi:peptidylprolyl isomerase [Halosegnis sp.]|uniref:FKBP-type peptidyl-prolyl cis-trans isomerase n=1 Tax=Halosegnis sp. TaxID=2864959 RepID=UPI0035D45492